MLDFTMIQEQIVYSCQMQDPKIMRLIREKEYVPLDFMMI